jgi:hypothetical protein
MWITFYFPLFPPLLYAPDILTGLVYQMNEAKAKTTKKGAGYRLLLVGIALLLRQAWVWLSGQVALARAGRAALGGRAAAGGDVGVAGLQPNTHLHQGQSRLLGTAL